MEKKDIPFLSASDLSRLIKSKEVSPVEAVEAYLERIELLDPKLKSYLTVCSDEAMQSAREAEQALARGEYLGPMHGIPVAVKDQMNTKGILTTGGSTLFKDFVPDEDATVIANLKASGAILLGKLNMVELASSVTHRFKTPRNPWDLERWTGGSSSGSGAATAAFLCATSLGEDTGGSIRWPASWCGLVGLRASYGRVSRYGVMSGVWSMDAVGPISRTVEDCAMTLQAIAGYDPKDQHSYDLPVPDYRKALDGDIRGVRVGVVTEMLNSDQVEAETRDAVVKAISVLGELGANVEEVSVPLTEHAHAISGGVRVEAPLNRKQYLLHRLQDIGHYNRIEYLSRSLIPAQAYYKAQKLRALLRQQVLGALEDFDVLVHPTAGVPAQKVEPEATIGRKGVLSRPFWLLTNSFSLASTPALSVCCGFTSQNLPMGLQIGSRPFDEEMALRVAYAYEQSTPWHERKPPI